MGDWKNILADLDDDYLVGIANKGIVKRAYKDREEGNYRVLSAGEEAEVSVGEELVRIRAPLGESQCSCPSRTICRHVVLGILALREYTAEEAGEGELPGQPEKEGEDKPGEAGEKQAGSQAGEPEGLFKEIAEYPLLSVRRALGSRTLQGIISQVKAGEKPLMAYSSIITVQFPGWGHTVKLLSPLEYSSCTCHKKEFCIHKAAAVLWCKLEKGLAGLEELEREEAGKTDYDMAQIKEAAGQMKAFLEELLDTGLARISPEALDYLERLALISHNARLPRFEGHWRALYDSYGNYLKRKSSFRIQELMERQARLYLRVDMLLAAGDGSRVAELAGEFKAEYMPAGNLSLIGIAAEPFESQTGYEGETVYFLEAHTKEWYTYTYARPVYYGKPGRRGKPGKMQAPWGLPFPLEDMAEARLLLTGARCDGRRRLSSSQETKGELTGNRGRKNPLHTGELGNWYYRDFEKLFRERIGKKRRLWLKEEEEEGEGTELVFIRADSCGKAFFSGTEQKLYMELYDGMGREIVMEVAYSRKESWGIRYLERVTEEKLPCFLGRVYLREGRIRMYPVAAFEEGELLEDGGTE